MRNPGRAPVSVNAAAPLSNPEKLAVTVPDICPVPLIAPERVRFEIVNGVFYADATFAIAAKSPQSKASGLRPPSQSTAHPPCRDLLERPN